MPKSGSKPVKGFLTLSRQSSTCQEGGSLKEVPMPRYLEESTEPEEELDTPDRKLSLRQPLLVNRGEQKEETLTVQKRGFRFLNSLASTFKNIHESTQDHSQQQGSSSVSSSSEGSP